MNSIDQLIRESGISIMAFSKIAGVSYCQIIRIIKDKSTPTLLTAMKISKALDRPIEEIFRY